METMKRRRAPVGSHHNEEPFVTETLQIPSLPLQVSYNVPACGVDGRPKNAFILASCALKIVLRDAGMGFVAKIENDALALTAEQAEQPLADIIYDDNTALSGVAWDEKEAIEALGGAFLAAAQTGAVATIEHLGQGNCLVRLWRHNDEKSVHCTEIGILHDPRRANASPV